LKFITEGDEQTGIRKAFLLAMGFRSGKARLLHPLNEPDNYWELDEETQKWVLRPKWLASYQDNATWHDQLCKFVRAKAPECWHHADRQELEGLTDAEISERLAIAFKHFKNKYRRDNPRLARHITDGDSDGNPNENVAKQRRQQ
jgi:chromatin segregation and condensation protein Rec8/ScpA/Scc1 (kleisin family)